MGAEGSFDPVCFKYKSVSTENGMLSSGLNIFIMNKISSSGISGQSSFFKVGSLEIEWASIIEKMICRKRGREIFVELSRAEWNELNVIAQVKVKRLGRAKILFAIFWSTSSHIPFWISLITDGTKLGNSWTEEFNSEKSLKSLSMRKEAPAVLLEITSILENKVWLKIWRKEWIRNGFNFWWNQKTDFASKSVWLNSTSWSRMNESEKISSGLTYQIAVD